MSLHGLQLRAIPLEIPTGANIIVGQSHFIKTVEDLYEALTTAVPQMKFGVAFNEASGPCLTRSDGNSAELRAAAVKICTDVAAGHMFAIVMTDAFPINVLGAVKRVPEIVGVFCATANAVEVIVAETAQGRGILGVVDGVSPHGLENDEQAAARHQFLRTIGYKR